MNQHNPIDKVNTMGQKILTVTITAVILLTGLMVTIRITARGAQVDTSAVASANRLYETNNFKEAAYIYEQLVSGGVSDSVIFYNLGNTYYRLGNLGRAILNYQRAAQLDPRDEDIQSNLILARSQSTLQLPINGPNPLTSLADLTSHRLTLNETALIALSLWFLGAMFVSIWRHADRENSRKKLQYVWVIIFLLAVMTAASLGSRIYAQHTSPIGVVITPEVTVSSSPGELSPTEIFLQSGTEVQLLEKRGEWVRLSLPGDENEGWLPASAIETVSGYGQKEIRL